MLQIKDIRKQYITGDLVQTALDGVSLTLRDNEFVAILGPSGSGKTTLLNVIGGLDRYDSGDLIINGISTKKYSDRDWDSYRNHTIGFVFQSYNLIPHQTVLSNVELALTISGISRSERRKRAKAALEAVGLGNQLHKKPNQMSGGQMQRVAIARALVNNPDILLADEPTGALDTQTSVQIMDLLKEVARDRLVVMVTHNPELAEQYATRIVRVKDGKITGDSDPYDPNTQSAARHANMGKSSMSFLTALSLSFNNLWTKKARTLLTAFAGSIGIIGIALIMSLSTGFQKYIDKIQEDTLSNYPLTIQSETADMTAALGAMGASAAEMEENRQEGVVLEQPMVSEIFGRIGSNDLRSFKAHLDDNMSQIDHTLNAVQYSYSLKPRIFSADTSDGVVQVNPATLFSKLTGSSTMSAFMDSDIFYEMLDNVELLESQYDVLQGRWPEFYNEMVLVLQDPNQMSDYMAYALGLREPTMLEDMINKVMAGEEPEALDTPAMEWTYDELMAMKFRLVPASSLYRYNREYQVWEDLSDDESYMRQLVDSGEELVIVGIVAPKEGVSTTALTAGIAYTSALTRHVIDDAAESEIVAQQLADSQTDVFTGTEFGAEEEKEGLNFQDMVTVDEEAISSAFNMDVDEDAIMATMEEYLSDVMGSLNVDTGPAQAAFVDGLTELSTDFLQSYIEENADETGAAVLRVVDAEAIVTEYLSGETADQVIRGLSRRYGLPGDTFRQVYQPLLIGLVTGYVADEMVDCEAIPEAIPEIPMESVPEITLPEPSLPANAPEAESTEPTEATEATENTEPTEATEVTENTESTETTEVTENTEPTEATEVTETTEPTEATEVTETTEPTEATEVTENTEPTEATEVTENTEPTETTEVTESTEPTEPTLPSIPVESLPEITLPEDMTIPEVTIPEVEIDPEQFAASITADRVEPLVAEFTANPVVTGVAGVLSGKMMESTIQSNLMSQIANLGSVMMNSLGGGFSVDQEALSAAFQFNMNEEDLRRLMEAMSTANKEVSADANLRTLGYADLDSPTSMSIYFVDFAAKEEFLDFLDGYNADMEAAGKEDQVIRYTDLTGIMMSSVRTIIDAVSYALIAFVAVSLVVSSIMIGIITYISVMERTKEIGVLRAIGASKRNISQVFNAETFIIGLCSGLIGVGITLLLLIPGNRLIYHLTENPDIVAQLPVVNGVALVALSVLLTLIGGFIPAKQAAKKDPVIALRSE